mgnify:CR=1 FL=1
MLINKICPITVSFPDTAYRMTFGIMFYVATYEFMQDIVFRLVKEYFHVVS